MRRGARRYRLRSLEEFRYTEDNKDKGAGIRDRAKGILELMNDHESLKAVCAGVTGFRSYQWSFSLW